MSGPSHSEIAKVPAGLCMRIEARPSWRWLLPRHGHDGGILSRIVAVPNSLAGGRTSQSRTRARRRGADVPQQYLPEEPAGPRTRLLGFERVDLDPGQSQTVALDVVPRLLASYDTDRGQWHTAAGSYRLALGRSAGNYALEANVHLAVSWFGR